MIIVDIALHSLWGHFMFLKPDRPSFSTRKMFSLGSEVRFNEHLTHTLHIRISETTYKPTYQLYRVVGLAQERLFIWSGLILAYTYRPPSRCLNGKQLCWCHITCNRPLWMYHSNCLWSFMLSFKLFWWKVKFCVRMENDNIKMQISSNYKAVTWTRKRSRDESAKTWKQ